MNFDDVTIFGKKTFADLLKNIYDNQKKSESQITDMIMALRPYIQSAGEAVMIVPLIKEYLDIKVKNDEHLIKMAAIVQRCIGSSPSDNSNEFNISDEEKEALLQEINSMGNSQKLISEKIMVKE
jgi:hypothetical protein